MTEIPHGLIKGQVIERTDWTDNLFSLTVKAPIDAYQAGQFTKLALLDSQGEWLRRAYSMVNHPSHKLGTDCMEFLIIQDDAGKLSPLLNNLNVGESIFVGKTPSGFMTLAEIPTTSKDLWLLATGTAIGPFLAMLGEGQALQRFDNIVLVHAVRTEAELVYANRIQQLVDTLAGKLHFIAIVSRELVEGTLQGRIPDLIKSGELEAQLPVKLDKSRSFIYLCGNPGMVKDTSNTLVELGYNKHLRKAAGQFSYENYW